MSIEAAPPPTYSYSGDTSSPPNSPSPSEDLVSAQSHYSSSSPADADGCIGEQDPPEVDAAPHPPDAPISAGLPPSDQYYPLPFPQRRPASSTPIAVSSEARISAFPDHKFQHSSPRLRLANNTTADSSTAGPKLNPTNYVSVFRKTHKRAFSLSRFNASIKGTFAVNPFLDIPAQLLSPLAPGEATRKNLVLKVENGGIDVDVHLIGEPAPNASNPVARTELHLALCGGPENSFPLIAKIHTPTLRRPPFRLTLESKNGFLSLHLPPSFHGLMTVRVGAGDLNNHITLSAALGAHATILSEDSTSRAYFIGALGMGRWECDRAEIGVERGRVRVQFSGAGERDLDGIRRVGWELMGF